MEIKYMVLQIKEIKSYRLSQKEKKPSNDNGQTNVGWRNTIREPTFNILKLK